MAAAAVLMALCCWPAEVHFDEPGWQAAWVWGSKHMDQGPGYFRMTFTVRGQVKQAVLQTTGDDSFDLFVNGVKIAHGGFSYGHAYTFDVTKHLRQGKNVVAAVCYNGAYPGGWLAELTINYADGRRQLVASGDQVRFAAEEHKGWTAPDFDDSGWERARVVARPPKGVWGPLPHEDYARAYPLDVVAARLPSVLRAGEPAAVELQVKPREAIDTDVGMVVEVIAFGRPLTIARVAPDPRTSRWQPGRTYTIRAPIKVTRFMPSMKTKLRVRLARCVLGRRKNIERPVEICATVKPGTTPAKVARWQGEPTIWLKIDGRWQPVVPYIFAGARLVDSYWRAARVGRVKIVQCLINIPYGWWYNRKPDFSNIDLALVKVLTWCPDAYVLPRIGVSAAPVWVEKHPGEAMRFADGTGWVPDRYGGTKHQSMASELWRREAAEGLRAVIRHIQRQPYSRRVIGYHVCSGIYGEWHLWAPGHIPDVSEPMRRRFVRWCQDKYGSLAALNRAWGLHGERALSSWDQIKCPGIPERNASDLGCFKDLSKSRYVADYWQCLHEATVEAIANLARVVKRETRRQALCGAFYGYITDLGWAQEGGHLAVSEHLRNPDIDFLCSPHSYVRREPGGDAGFRAYPRSIRLHGKLFIDENDDRTYLTTESDGLRHVNTLRETLNLMRRGLANAIANRCGEWLFDLSGGWFVGEEFGREFRRERRIFEQALRSWRDSGAAETAVVCSPKSFFTLADWKSGKDRLTPGLFQREYGNFYRMGAPFDTVLADDVGGDGLPRYKVYVLLNCYYLTDERRRRWAELMHNAVVVAAYAPGFSSDCGLSADHISELMGMRVQLRRRGPLTLTLTEAGARLLGGSPDDRFGFTCPQDPRFAIIPGRPPDGWDGQVVALAEYADGSGCGLAALVQGGRVRRIYSAAGALPPALLRAALKAAGAHIWLDTDDVLYCNPPLIAVHARTDGPKRLTIPEPWRSMAIEDAFSGDELNADRRGLIQLEMRRAETRVMMVERNR